MLKTITKVGNSQGLILDAALMELAGLKVGDAVNVTVHEGGTIVVTPMAPAIGKDEAGGSAAKIVRRNRELFRRLA
jgi:antitoxin component of MazEF toxin-antitoxin module